MKKKRFTLPIRHTRTGTPRAATVLAAITALAALTLTARP